MAVGSAKARDTVYEQALENCSRDPIHLPGEIQSFGYLIGADKKFQNILFASENVEDIYPFTAAETIGQPSANFFARDELHQIRNVLGHENIGERREVLALKHFGDREFQVTLHRKGEHAILELVEEQLRFDARVKIAERSRSFLNIDLRHDRLNAFFEDAVEYIRSITGFDRVKFYRFLHDGAGEVIAETRHPSMASYLGLRFPASDVPAIARKLYAETPIRVISDVDGPDVALIGDASNGPLDMSLAILRGKDRVHRQYLENMGVRATLTVPIVIDGVLWGLFACHHPKPIVPDPSVLSALELAGKLMGLRVQHALETQRQELRTRCLTSAIKITAVDASDNDIGELSADVIDELKSLLPCDDVILSISDRTLVSDGIDLPSARLLLDGLETDQGVITADDLAERFPNANLGGAVATLAFAVESIPPVRVAFLRRPAKASISWAGQTKKHITFESSGPRLHPRKSFETYVEIIEDFALAWETEHFEIGNALCQALEQTLAAQFALRESQTRQVVLARELNHHIRNTLTLVQSMSMHSQQDGVSMGENAGTLEARLLALVRFQNRVVDFRVDGTSIWEILRLEVAARSDSEQSIRMNGPDVNLAPEATTVLSAVVHELATNSASFGALSGHEGDVSVSWALEDGALHFRWHETGGPTYPEAIQTGFGASIIREAVPYEVGGESTLEFAPDGLTAECVIPTEHVFRVSDVDRPISKVPNILEPDRLGEQKRALVVEDNYIIASMVRRFLIEAGFKAVDTAGNLSDGRAMVESEHYDFCLLDIKLGRETGTPLANLLNQKKIPFAFATGYVEEGSKFGENYGAPVIAKPLDIRDLGVVLEKLLKDPKNSG